jgi:hypothetical protein
MPQTLTNWRARWQERQEAELAEALRRVRLIEINSERGPREELEARHVQVWDTDELAREFDVEGFMAPFIVVRRKADGVVGSLEFQHSPRFYFNFKEDRR